MKNRYKIGLTAASRWAVTTAFLLPVAAVGPVQGQDATERCSPLHRTSTGRQVDASYSAHRYSQQNIGAVGIFIFPGRDLSNQSAHGLGLKLVEVMKINGLDAACFVHNERHGNGTGVNFKITGLSWKKDGPLNVAQALERETLRGVVAEATTARALLPANSNR